MSGAASRETRAVFAGGGGGRVPTVLLRVRRHPHRRPEDALEVGGNTAPELIPKVLHPIELAASNQLQDLRQAAPR